MSGYVRIHRSLIGHPAFRNDAEAMAFAWLVMRAAWKPIRVRYKERGIHLKRGQLAVSVRDFAAAHERNKNWVSRVLRRLRDEDMIETDAGTGVLVITIRKYDEYQAEAPTLGTAQGTAEGTRPGTDAGQTRDTEQVREEIKEVSSEANASSPRLWACPSGVEPKHWRDFLKNRRTKRATNSESAYEGQLRELEKLADDDWPPGRLVQHAAESGWAGIHDPRKSLNGQSYERSDRDPTTVALEILSGVHAH